TISIESKALNEKRNLTIYFPKNFSTNKKYNVIYMADGQLLTDDYKEKIDSLINIKKISEIVIIGVNSNETDIPNSYLQLRNYEYVEKNDAKDGTELAARFKNHLTFFMNEVNEYATKELKLKSKKKYFYGASNGAGFGVNLLNKYPNYFTGFILYSVAGENKDNFNESVIKSPKIIIRYGKEEVEPLILNNIELIDLLKTKKYNVISSSYDGRHKRKDWLNNFTKDIQTIN
ncbi:MAG: alpha/beta hydrolase-fold protein, partial [Algoriella sp.]